jgi:hypothetical protein
MFVLLPLLIPDRLIHTRGPARRNARNFFALLGGVVEFTTRVTTTFINNKKKERRRLLTCCTR